ncbi:MAG: hypothetical protein QNJ45_07890 [Ardenticatenaceae bacterium]|nr:hypothetical protein [Ardenticatenaceae bacterium]
MFSNQEFQELLNFTAAQSQVITLYLNTDIGQEPQEVIRLKAKNLLKTLPDIFEEDVEKIETYLDREFDWKPSGLAIFSCAAEGLWRVIPTYVSFRNRIRTSSKPHVKPLAHLLDHYGHYGVILIDRLGARFYAYHLGHCVDSDGYMGEENRKLKAGAGSSAVGLKGGSDGSRHVLETWQRNSREAASAAAGFFEGHPIRRLFLGGAAETISYFQLQLPRQLQACIAGQFNIDMDAPELEVQQKSIALLGETNARREASLVREMIDRAKSGGNGVLTLDPTLKAVFEGRVKTLIISDGFRQKGYSYQDTGFLSSELVIDQPEAAGQPQRVEDVVEAAVERTLSQGGHVELISENEELEESGKIGAILRY